MNETDLDDDALDALLHAGAPEPLADAGFVLRTMTAVDQAARSLPAVRRAAPLAPIDVARALLAEQRRHAAQARLWRWGVAGVIAGFFLMIVTVAVSPGDVTLTVADPRDCYPLPLMLAAGALWQAWRKFREN